MHFGSCGACLSRYTSLRNPPVRTRPSPENFEAIKTHPASQTRNFRRSVRAQDVIDTHDLTCRDRAVMSFLRSARQLGCNQQLWHGSGLCVRATTNRFRLRNRETVSNNDYITNRLRSITAQKRLNMDAGHKGQTCSLHYAFISPKLHTTPSLSDSQAWTQL